MFNSDTSRSATIGPSALIIPAGCAMLAQFMQHVYAVGFDASDLSTTSLMSPLLMFSFLKIVALVVLAVHFARLLVVRNDPRHAAPAGGQADRFLGLILAVNVAFACLVLSSIGFIESEAFARFAELGITKTVAKLVLVCVLLGLIMPLNKRVFRDVSIAIGSNATMPTQAPFTSDPNKPFLKSLTVNSVRYILPAYVAHVVLAMGIAKYEALILPLAAADAVVLVGLGLLAGHALFRSHEEVLATAG